MVTLVHHECIARDRFRVDLIGIEEEDKLGLRRRGLLRGYETNVICGGSRCNLYTNH